MNVNCYYGYSKYVADIAVVNLNIADTH